jgi:hypothetical protein
VSRIGESGIESTDWWLIGNGNFGVHTAEGRTAKDAKADVRARIAETYAGDGLPTSACRRAASSYRVFVIAGHLSYAEAAAARKAWDRDDYEPAERLARQHRNRRRRN